MIFKNQARGTEDKRKKEFVNVSSSNRFIWSCSQDKVNVIMVGSAAIRFP